MASKAALALCVTRLAPSAGLVGRLAILPGPALALADLVLTAAYLAGMAVLFAALLLISMAALVFTRRIVVLRILCLAIHDVLHVLGMNSSASGVPKTGQAYEGAPNCPKGAASICARRMAPVLSCHYQNSSRRPFRLAAGPASMIFAAHPWARDRSPIF